MDKDALSEAGWAAQLAAGLSAYLYSTGYSHEQFKEDLDQMVKHIQESAQE